MKRAVATMLMLVFVTVVAGCQPRTSASTKGYAVMFEKRPQLITAAVFHQGVEIGKIVAAGTGFAGIVELTVAVDSAYRDLMTEDAVFYPVAGRLEYSRLSPAGGPIAEDTPVLGFSSRLSYNWYRFKTLLSSRHAAEQARALQERYRWAEPVALTL